MSPTLPPRALHAANAILARLTETRWSPADRDTAAALIARELNEDKAREACKLLLRAVHVATVNSQSATIRLSDLQPAIRAAELALNR